ncbi:L-glyceraldehyde 3-phosphate reductase [Aurantimicrobium minutum]|uniref:aldo/keto reductase n=1 Tax=Aurantimicrobium minutum TaxID=708131 RepID=UPI002475D34F|nr:aldo/keto reductase [Aurantimicrobium minutum]MDH6410519.1 L-glyceraldehyde 3-phosphate reductase [Aurantimicrobium minutum]MDH6425332.1 L-glyceraldehyde 3-phosphate reductase [Aurantimicrobium minutum]
MAYDAASTRYDIMNFRRSGKSGLKLPEISLGLWHNFGDEGSLKNQRAILRRAFDMGVTHFDLANNYGVPAGSAESHFGDVLASDFKPYRDEMVISSKAGYFMWDGPYGEWGSRKYLISSLDQSLKRMGLDYVDIFYSHRPDPDTPIEETMGALASVVQQGKALYVGISSYTPEQTLAAKKELDRLGVPLLIHQPRYSMFDRTIERSGLLYTLDEIGAGCIVFSPLAQGLLTDRYLKGIPKDSRAALGEHLKSSSISDIYLERVRGLSAIAEARGQTLAQMALLWTLRNPGVTSALIGASSVQQLEDNLAAIHGPEFEQEELDAIDVFAVHGTDSGSHRKS